MEFPSRKKCIEHYQEHYPHLPRYMIEMALDYDLANGASSNEKPKSGAEKRKAKRLKQMQGERDTSIAKAIQSGTSELSTISVVPQDEFTPAPFVKGYISLDGMLDTDTASVLQNVDQETLDTLKAKAIESKDDFENE